MREPWIGLVTVRPVPGTDPWDGAAGASAHTVALARDHAEFLTAVKEFFEHGGYSVEEVEG